MTRREQLVSSLSDDQYRHALADQHVASMLPFQLRAMREQRGWTQQQLGERCGKKQEWISKLENPQYARFTLQTLKTLARAFDVALQVKFVPFSDLVDWLSTRRPGDLHVSSYADDAALATTETTAEPQCFKVIRGAAGTNTQRELSFMGPELVITNGAKTGATRQIAQYQATAATAAVSFGDTTHVEQISKKERAV